VASGGEAGEGRVLPTLGPDDERELVRAFTDLHRQAQFTPATRPVAPMRARQHSASDIIEAQAVEAHVVDGPAADTPAIDTQVVEAEVVEAPAADTPAIDTQVTEAEVVEAPAVDKPSVDTQVGAAGADDAPRRGWAGTAERRLSDVLALAGASGALIAPWPWLLAVTGVCLAVGAVRSVAAGPGSVAVRIATLPRRAARRVGRLLRPRSLARLPAIAVKTILVAFVLPGAVAAVIWVAEHGLDGVLAAARLAAWQSGARVFAAVLCLMMLAGVGDTRARRAGRVRRATASWPDAAVVSLAAGALALAVAVVAVGPRVSGGILTGHDGLAWVPAPVRPAVDGVRDDVVATELRTLRSCLSRHQGLDWSAGFTSGNPVDHPDVARLALGGQYAPAPSTLVTAALAADNQLAPWVEVVEITVDDTVVLELDRRELGHHGVRLDPATLGPGITSGGGVMLSGAAGVDRRVAVVCSAGPAF
jgi:hypothetical protein